MKFVLGFVLGLFSFATIGKAVVTPTLDIKLVAELDKDEPYETLVFNNGVFWSGNTYTNGEVRRFAHAFDAEGKELASVEMPHSMEGLYPFEGGA